MTDTPADLHAVAEEALRRATKILLDAYSRISDTDLDPAVHADEVCRLLGDLSVPQGVMDQSLRRRTPRPLAQQIQERQAEAESWQGLAEAAADARDDLIRRALEDGERVMHIRDWTGLSRERIYQIRDRRR
jgi:hypothetical protein